MNTGNLTKRIFGGVAAGIALSSAIVVATSISHAPVNTNANPVVRIETKTDRTALFPVSEQVARTGKANALDFTISILRGSDTMFGDRITPTPDRNLAVLEPAPAPQSLDTAPAAIQPEALPEADVVTSDDQPEAKPSARTRNLAATRSGPTNIIPTPALTGNLPVTAPAETTTNFSVAPLGTTSAERDRQDLVR